MPLSLYRGVLGHLINREEQGRKGHTLHRPITDTVTPVYHCEETYLSTMSKLLYEYARDGDLASVDRITSTAEGRAKINNEKSVVSTSNSSPLC